MIQKLSLFLYLGFLCLLSACIDVQSSHQKLPPGIWRAELDLSNDSAPINAAVDRDLDQAIAKKGILPFNFEVIYDDANTFHIEIINDTERIRLDDIQYGRDLATAKDTLLINIPIYDSFIRAIFFENVIEGHWVVNYRENYFIPFLARFGQSHRFPEELTSKKTALDLNGKWKVLFENGTDDEYPAIGEFTQEGNLLRGTFLTETGDYRYLQGTVQENKFWLSCFDGSHAFLFEGKQMEDGSLLGSFRSGKHYQTTWIAQRDADFELKSAEELTYLNEGYDAFDFSFPNTEKQLISLNTPQFANKVKLIQVMGTWCPNCMDESKFLTEYLQNNPSDDLEVIAIAFERYKDEDIAFEKLRTYKQKMSIPYEIVLGGYYNKKSAAEKLPMLNAIISYPTLIFIDKNNQVRKIHTGFSGPATSEFEEFSNSFDKFIKLLISE